MQNLFNNLISHYSNVKNILLKTKINKNNNKVLENIKNKIFP